MVGEAELVNEIANQSSNNSFFKNNFLFDLVADYRFWIIVIPALTILSIILKNKRKIKRFFS